MQAQRRQIAKKKRDGHNMFLEGRKPGPSMTMHVGKTILSLHD